MRFLIITSCLLAVSSGQHFMNHQYTEHSPVGGRYGVPLESQEIVDSRQTHLASVKSSKVYSPAQVNSYDSFDHPNHYESSHFSPTEFGPSHYAPADFGSSHHGLSDYAESPLSSKLSSSKYVPFQYAKASYGSSKFSQPLFTPSEFALENFGPKNFGPSNYEKVTAGFNGGPSNYEKVSSGFNSGPSNYEKSSSGFSGPSYFGKNSPSPNSGLSQYGKTSAYNSGPSNYEKSYYNAGPSNYEKSSYYNPGQSNYAKNSQYNGEPSHYEKTVQTQEFPRIGHNGVPLDTAEVAAAKAAHLEAHARAAIVANAARLNHRFRRDAHGHATSTQNHNAYFGKHHKYDGGGHEGHEHGHAHGLSHYRKRREAHGHATSTQNHNAYFGKHHKFQVSGGHEHYGHLSVPHETAEVTRAKVDHFAAHKALGGHYRRRRDATSTANLYSHFGHHKKFAVSGGHGHHGHHTGQLQVPYDTAEITLAKQAHFAAHAALRSHH